MAERKPISQKTRFEVFKRDSFRCQYCGQSPPAVVLEVDHFEAVAAGGSNDIDNLITSCADCNRGKGAGDVTAPPDTVAEKHAKQQAAAEQLRAYNAFKMELRAEADRIIERLGLEWFGRINGKRNKYVFGDARVASVRTFLKDLGESDVLDAIEIAFERFPVRKGEDDVRTWKYFCGVCWRKIRPEARDA